MHVAAIAIAAATDTSTVTERRSVPGDAPLQRTPSMATGAGRGQQQQLCYLIESSDQGVLQLSLWVTELMPDRRQIDAERARLFVPRLAGGAGELPRYVDAQDREILRILTAQRHESPWPISGTTGAAIVRLLAATGRAFWQALNTQPLRAGAARRIVFEWQALPNGEQRLQSQGPSSTHVELQGEPAFYVDATAAECGALDLPYPANLLRRYRQSAVSPDQVARINEQIAFDDPNAAFPRLRALTIRKEALASLQARLVLSPGPTATLHFVYNGAAIDSRIPCADQATVRRFDAAAGTDVLHEIDRNGGAEQVLQDRFAVAMSGVARDRESWLTFMMLTVPLLQAEGWEVACTDDFPYRIALAGEWFADLDTQRRDGWFDLQLGVTVDGHYVNLMPALIACLQAERDLSNADCQRVGEQMLIRLDDGRYLPIAMARIERVADTLVELHDQGSLNRHQSLSLPMTQVGRIAQLTLDADAPTVRSQDRSLSTLLDDLKSFRGLQPLAAPEHFQATLRPYQEQGLGWLQFLRRYRLGGILADDMGLGKTVQTLAHLWLEKSAGRLQQPALIVCPVSVIGNWQQELRRFTPQLKVVTLHGSRRREQFVRIRSVDVVITGYSLLQLDSEILQQHDFSLLILDEAQTIKNPRAKVSQAARALHAEQRLCLTGTPMENHLGELWALFDFLQPGLLGTQSQFQRGYRDAIEKNGDERRAAALARRIAPVMLRRTKDAVAGDLPAKTQIVESIVLDDRQRDFYDGIRLAVHRKVQEVIQEQGLARSQITVLDALLKLRQACCDPRLVEDSAEARSIPSAKLDWLRTVLPELVAEGRRVLLFSQFTSMLALIEQEVRELGIDYCLLTGATQERAALVARFQAGTVPLFLISLKAGGTGLNLTAADTVIHYDPWWNPAVEAQATDRAHRIGQDQPVFVYKLIAQGTVEEKIMQLQADKHSLASQLYTAKSATPTQLSAADLERLFAP